MSAVAVMATGDLTSGAAKRVDVDGHRLAVVRIGDDFYVIGDRCSHADYSLSEGEVYENDRTIECWKHGSLFDLETGQPKTLPATEPVPTYKVFVENNQVMVELS